MFFRKIMFALSLLSLSMLNTAHANVADWSKLKNVPKSERLDHAKKLIEAATRTIPDGLEKQADIEQAFLIYFIESHIVRLQLVGLDCKSQNKAAERAQAFSLPREADPNEMPEAHKKELKLLIAGLCQ